MGSCPRPAKEEEGEARQQGPVHLEDVPEGGLGHSGAEEPAGGRRPVLGLRDGGQVAGRDQCDSATSFIVSLSFSYLTSCHWRQFLSRWASRRICSSSGEARACFGFTQ